MKHALSIKATTFSDAELERIQAKSRNIAGITSRETADLLAALPGLCSELKLRRAQARAVEKDGFVTVHPALGAGAPSAEPFDDPEVCLQDIHGLLLHLVDEIADIRAHLTEPVAATIMLGKTVPVK